MFDGLNEEIVNSHIKEGKPVERLLYVDPKTNQHVFKNEEINFTLNFHLPNMLTHVQENQVVGNVEIVIDGVVVDSINLLSCETYDKATLWDYFKEIIGS